MSDNEQAPPPDRDNSGAGRKRPRPAALSTEALQKFADVEHQKGVCYISRIPPFMKPIKIRHLLEKGGEVGRIYLAPEDPAATKRRVKAGGNKKVQFTEGWVEFLDKQDAKNTAELLNSTPMGSNNRGFYASDLWNIKYLKHFKWHHLTEKIAYEQRTSATKLRVELSQAKKDADNYLERVDQAKAISGMEAKRKQRGREREAGAGGGGEGEGSERMKKQKREGEGGEAGTGADDLNSVRRKFKQRRSLADPAL